MEFIRHFIEQKISSAAGAAVRFGKFSFSPLSGAIEVHDLTVGTLLTVKKIEAKIVVSRALKQEIVIRSLAIEAPSVTIARHLDGTTNLPLAPSQKKSATDKKSWEFQANNILLVGGRVAATDHSGYQITLENLNGSVEMKSSTDAEFVFAADSLGRRDKPVELGEAKLIGKMAGPLSFTLTAGSILNLSVQTPAIDSGHVDFEMNLATSFATLLALLPPSVHLPIATATGDVKLSAAAGCDRDSKTISIQSFDLHTADVTLR